MEQGMCCMLVQKQVRPKKNWMQLRSMAYKALIAGGLHPIQISNDMLQGIISTCTYIRKRELGEPTTLTYSHGLVRYGLTLEGGCVFEMTLPLGYEYSE